jgi:hypothetical protein
MEEQQMFEFLFSKKVKTLSFFDWAQRVSVSLEEAKKEVHNSTLEDTDANYLNHFRVSARNLSAVAGSIRLNVDMGGIYTNIYGVYSIEKLYVLEFTADLRVAGLPLAQSYTNVSVSRHVAGIVSLRYQHLLSKLTSQINRLDSEMWSARSGEKFLKSMIEKTSKSVKGLQELPAGQDNAYWGEEQTQLINIPKTQLINIPKQKAPAKKKKKAKPAAKAISKK